MLVLNRHIDECLLLENSLSGEKIVVMLSKVTSLRSAKIGVDAGPSWRAARLDKNGKRQSFETV
jgi:hypothetical protein